MQNLAKALRPGDTIGIVAPASPTQSEERIEKSVRYFEKLGYRVELGKHIRAAQGYLADSDNDRVSDIHSMFRGKNVKAIFYLRGGFGSIRLLDKIDYDLVRQNPKIIVGYSDATALFAALYKNAGLRSCFFGPMPGVDLWDEIDPFTEENLWQALTNTEPSQSDVLWLGSKFLNPKSQTPFPIRGRMIGGNLTVFASLFGTSYQPNFKSTILFIEEIGEKPRKIDACLAQLRLSGLFERVNAILLGRFTKCNSDPEGPTLRLQEVFDDYFSKMKIPVIANLPFGHEKRMITIPFGAKLLINASGKKAKISVVESVLM